VAWSQQPDTSEDYLTQAPTHPPTKPLYGASTALAPAEGFLQESSHGLAFSSPGVGTGGGTWPPMINQSAMLPLEVPPDEDDFLAIHPGYLPSPGTAPFANGTTRSPLNSHGQHESELWADIMEEMVDDSLWSEG